MEIVTCSWDAKRGAVHKSFLSGKTVIKAGGRKVTLPNDVAKSKASIIQNEMTGARMFLIIILALTLIGLILAIPLYFISKKRRVNLTIKTKDGETITVAASNNKETKLLQKYADIGIFD